MSLILQVFCFTLVLIILLLNGAIKGVKADGDPSQDAVTHCHKQLKIKKDENPETLEKHKDRRMECYDYCIFSYLGFPFSGEILLTDKLVEDVKTEALKKSKAWASLAEEIEKCRNKGNDKSKTKCENARMFAQCEAQVITKYL